MTGWKLWNFIFNLIIVFLSNYVCIISRKISTSYQCQTITPRYLEFFWYTFCRSFWLSCVFYNRFDVTDQIFLCPEQNKQIKFSCPFQTRLHPTTAMCIFTPSAFPLLHMGARSFQIGRYLRPLDGFENSLEAFSRDQILVYIEILSGGLIDAANSVGASFWRGRAVLQHSFFRCIIEVYSGVSAMLSYVHHVHINLRIRGICETRVRISPVPWDFL